MRHFWLDSNTVEVYHDFRHFIPRVMLLYFTVKYDIQASEIIYRKQDTGAL